jgi:hypothetical protein
MGAMQAQDYASAKWAIGIRLQSATDKSVETAINKGEIIRTHVLRPTWHLVSANDIYWMLELTAPHIRSSLKSRHKELELDEKLLTKAYVLLEKALSGGKNLLREDLFALLEKTKIITSSQRGIHILLMAELNGLIGSGPKTGNQQSYALLEERVPKKKTLNREQALATLAQQYFTSHGPATLQDFAWWSGLPTGDVKKGLELIKDDLKSSTILSQTYWYSGSASVPKNKSAFLLPAYDEFIISYKDRTPSLPLENHSKTISSNGIFRSVIVLNGQVIGLWKRTIKKDKILIEPDYFKSPNKTEKELIEKASEDLGKFLNLQAEFKG